MRCPRAARGGRHAQRARWVLRPCLPARVSLVLLLATGCTRYAMVPLDLGPILHNPVAAPVRGHAAASCACAQVPARGDTLRIVTYNIAFNQRMGAAREELQSVPALCHADVYLLQEVDLDGTRYIADALGCGYIYDAVSYHPRSAHGFWGNAILSPHPLSDAWRATLPGNAALTNRRMVGGIVHHRSGDISVVSLHAETSVFNLVPWGGGQADQWRFAARTAVARAQRPARILVGGDFNSAPILPLLFPTVSKLDAIFGASRFVRLTPGDAPTSRGHGYRLDHVYGIGFDAGPSGVHSAAEASDHFPVWCVVTASR